MSDAGDRAPPRRRAGDRPPGTARALQWALRDNDVLLLPHSPLALADVLGHPGGYFDLLACETPDLVSRTMQEQDVDAAPRVQSITASPKRARGRGRMPRTSGNLLTQHSTETLRERARSAVVESALVKQRSERRLYLVAGFLRADGLDAPVLLYPALLVPPHDVDGPRLRIEDTVPDQNRQAIAHCRVAYDVRLPLLEADELLSDYFARLGAAIAPVPGLELAYEVAIGNADSSFLNDPADGDALPAMPAGFDSTLAMALALELSLEQLQSVLNLLPSVRGGSAALPGFELASTPSRLVASAVADSVSGATATATTARTTVGERGATASLRDYAVKLAARGLNHIAFDELAGLPERIERWRSAIGRANRCTTVTKLFAGHVFTARQLACLGGIIELIDKAPQAIETARHPNLAYESTSQLLRRARHQAQLIEDEFAALRSVFVLDKVPAKSELLQLMDELGGVHGELAVVDPDYFLARRQFTEFSVDKPTQLDETHRARLAQLVKVLRFRELFVNNTEYRRALGAGYRGLRTDWAALTTLVDYARELATVLGSEALAATAISDFSAFRRTLVDDLDDLRSAGDALRTAVSTIGREWQTRPVDTLLVQLGDTAVRLRDWQQRFGDPTPHGRLTAARILSRADELAHDDAASERQLHIARERIEQSLRSEGADAVAVARTLDWLRIASLTATERRLDIGVIVGRLQIA